MAKNETRSYRYGWFLFSLAALFYCYEYLLRIAPSVMSAELMGYYALNATAFGNLFAIYYYIYTPMQLPVGLLFDRFSPRHLLTFACLVCAMGTAIFACSHYLGVAQIGRFFVGFGSAFAFVGVLKVASLSLPPSRFGMIAGLTTSLGMLGAMFGDNVITLLVERIGWQATTYGSAAFGLVMTAAIWFCMGKESGVNHPIGQPVVRMRSRELLANIFKLLKNKEMWLIGFIGAVLYTSLSVFAELWGIPYLEQGRGFTPQAAAALVSMVFLGWAIGGPIVGMASDFFNDRRMPLVVGNLLGSVTIATVIFIDGLSPVSIALLLFFFGVFASAENIAFVIAKESTGAHLTGSAVALTNMFVMFAGMVLQPLVGYFLDLFWDGHTVNGINHYNNVDFQYALLILPVTFLIAAGCSLFLKKSYSLQNVERVKATPN